MESFQLYIIIEDDDNGNVIYPPLIDVDENRILEKLEELTGDFRAAYKMETPEEYYEAYQEWVGEHHVEPRFTMWVQEVSVKTDIKLNFS